MKRPDWRRVEGLTLAVVAAVATALVCAGGAIRAMSRGTVLLDGRLPLALVLGFLSTLSVAAALVLWRERELRRARSAFVTAVSHELRTSLAQIRMFTETLREDRARTEEDRERSASIIGQEARRLAHLVETVRSYEALARDDLPLHPRVVNLAEVLAPAVEAFASMAGARGILLEADVPADLTLHADPEALAQVVGNLLDNALKYSRPGTVVRVGGGQDAATSRFWVEDSGPGVPHGEREAVWEPFRRLQRDPESTTGGGGLGLSVVRSLVRLHGGSCRVEDVPGGGARFVVELPQRE